MPYVYGKKTEQGYEEIKTMFLLGLWDSKEKNALGADEQAGKTIEDSCNRDRLLSWVQETDLSSAETTGGKVFKHLGELVEK